MLQDCGDSSGEVKGGFGQRRHFLGSSAKFSAVRECTNSGCCCACGRIKTGLLVALEKIPGCNDCFPPALNHCRPGQNEGDETGITMEISVEARK